MGLESADPATGVEMKKLLLGTVSALAMAAASSAGAADLTARPAYKAPPPIAAPVPFTWTGFYVGGHLGGAWGTKEWDFTTFQEPGSGPEFVDIPDSFTVNGFLGGGQVGYRLQFAQWVFGIEG